MMRIASHHTRRALAAKPARNLAPRMFAARRSVLGVMVGVHGGLASTHELPEIPHSAPISHEGHPLQHPSRRMPVACMHPRPAPPSSPCRHAAPWPPRSPQRGSSWARESPAAGTKPAWGRRWCAATWGTTRSGGSCGTLAEAPAAPQMSPWMLWRRPQGQQVSEAPQAPATS
jgi:hypothetical protein